MRMRIARSLAAASSGVALVLAGADARAQQFDLNPPLPDVLLLVDNSGSMERMVDGTLPEDNAANACDVSNCVVANGTPPVTTCTLATRASPLAQFPPPNRWNNVLQALTGSPANGYHCIAMPRAAGSTFATEYAINGASPYDTGYYLPYHRAVAMDPATPAGASQTTGSKPCVFAPGSLPGQASGTGGVGQSPGYASGGKASDFPAGAIINRPYGQLNVTNTPSPGITSTCNFAQNPDGLLGTYQDLIRFGLMTFDQDPSAGTGVSFTGANPPQVLATGSGAAFTGMWSYFPGWDGSSAANPASGWPSTACQQGSPTTPDIFELGARNPAAPPWEGRMVYFPTDETQATRDAQNAQIQAVLNATRPYGGTPMAGLFADAQYYFTNDPNGPNNPTSGKGDSLTKGGCRKQFIILLTDGAPNEDMRTTCGASNNPPTPCPYNTPDWTANALANPTGGQNPVYTYVIGFAVSSAANDQGTVVNCEQLNVSTDCASIATTDALYPCCELQKIAVAGAPPNTPSPHAYFANNPNDLQAALGAIFSQIARATTTRTVPAYSPSVTNVTYTAGTNTPNQEIFYGYFTPAPVTPTAGSLATVGEPWSGDVTRSRYICGATGAVQQPLSTSSGDDFASNLNTNNPARYFVAIEATTTSGAVADSSATLRPYYGSSTGGDGLGNAGVTQYAGTASSVVTNVSPAALKLPTGASSCAYTSSQIGAGQRYLADTDCRTMLLDFTFGQSYTPPRNDFTFVSRAGNAFGGVYHATPTVVGPPASLLHEDSYDGFATSAGVTACTSATASTGSGCRQPIVYAATTDGLLHAFWSDISTNNNNEQWAMLPPAVLPNILSSYPASDKFLLDGSPVVKDVVWDRPQGSTTGTGPPDVNGSTSNPWSTMLVAAYGPQQLGYYAVDITRPTASSTTPVSSSTPGPKFRWQLTTMPSTNAPLFGAHGATPAITTVFVGSPTPHEVGVAILPGGWNTPAVTPAGGAAGCARATASGGDVSQVGSYAYRTNVQCWGANGLASDPVVGRSVTVARLDTGEVIATFMRKSDILGTGTTTAPYPNDTLWAAGRIVDTPLDSPMTGTPAVYPPDVGADGTKVFMADQDGTVWKFDLSSTDPTKWTGKLFFDLYNKTVETASSAWSDGQPVQLPIVTSLDPTGELVLAVASGSQDQFTRSGLYFLYSLKETVQTTGGVSSLRSLVNWYLASSNDTALTPPAPQLTSQPGVMGPGERVSGPMVVFDGTLYFATYLAPPSTNLTCTAGKAFLWGRDYVKPYDATNVYEGGAFAANVVPGPTPPSLDLTASALAPAGAVVPGVSVQATTACIGLGSGSDPYFGGTRSAPSSYAAASFQLVGQVSATAGANAAASTLLQLPAPREPTMISSWAAVTE